MTEKQNEFEQDLRRLFDDDRLAVPAAAGAREAVVAGARRARKRREVAMVGGGIAVVAVAAVGGLVIARPPSGGDSEMAAGPGTTTLSAGESTSSTRPPSTGQKPDRSPVEDIESSETGEIPSGQPKPPAEPSSDAPSDPPAIPAVAGGPIGPSGWADLQLGMSFEEVRASGYIAQDAPAPAGCTSYSLTAGSEFVSAVLISDSGLGRIVAAESGRTPEDQGVGSPVEDLYTAYPSGTETTEEFRAETGEGATYVFAMGEDAVAHGLALTNGDC